MTEIEHEKIKRALKGSITRARNAMKKAPMLAEKIERMRTVKELEEKLQQHKLNFYVLTRS